jgi:hypothetical protein
VLDLISFYVFGTWAGYIGRKLSPKQPKQINRIVLSAAFWFACLSLLYYGGSSNVAIGRWPAFAAFGFYFSFGFNEDRLSKLRKTWAGVWILATFVAIESFRLYLVSLLAH